jgi:hypothetical protein
LSDVVGTIEYLAGELARLFEPVAQRAQNGTADSILEWVGLRPPDASTSANDLTSAITTLASGAAGLPDLIANLTSAIEAGDGSAGATAGVALLNQFSLVIKAAQNVSSALQALSSDPSLTASQQAELAAFAGEFVDRALNRLLVEYLEHRFPQISLPLIATGGIEILDQPGGPAGSLSGAYTQKTFHFERIAKLFTGPKDLLSDAFSWGQPGFDGVALFSALQTLLSKFDIPAQILQPAGMPATLEAFAFSATVDDSVAPPGLDLSVRVPASVTNSSSIDLGDWQATIATGASFAADLTAKIRPLVDVEIDLPTGTCDLQLKTTFQRSSTADPFLLLGVGGGSRLQVQSPSLNLKMDLHFDTTTQRLTIDPQVTAALHQGKLIVSGDGSDGFISTLLSGVNLESDFDIGLTWSPSQGIAFVASAGLQIQIPVHISLGPLDISSVVLGAELQSDGSIPIELSAGFSAALGPLSASVDRLGLISTFSFPKGGGNLGPANASFSFKPPTGVGLSVDAGVIQGGGFLYIDTARGEYAGALQLMFADFLGLQAIGLITTKMPDGSSGFSLLIVITVDFGAGIQLGFGFTLLAVGGLLGLNRSMLFQPLMDGIRTDSIESIMFPQDVIANAPRIISDLRAIFPPQQGTFLVGPMAKLGWGEPTLISLALGVIIEIPPGDIAILGILKLALPADDIAVLLLQVNFAGALEFDKQRLYFFASLFDSHILFITLEGEMGLLMAWGDNANFVVSMGGFHPQFNPPPLPFPSPKRIEVDIINESYARIRCDGYFAVTTNTVQFGAHSEYFFGFSALNLSGSSGFDALIQFSPFHFIADISTSFSVNVFGVGCYGIDMDLSLEGPTPWHAHGTASISFLFFSIGIGVDFTWGDSRNTMLPPIAVMPILSGEFGKQSNWKAVLPKGSNLLVTLRQLDPSESDMVLHPVGTLHVSQRAVPLDLTLDKDGNQQPSDANYFTLDVSSGGLSKTQTLTERFAPAQFKNMGDATKLSQPAYVPMDSGIELSAAGSAYASGTAITRNVRYDLTVIDTKLRRVFRRFYVYTGSLFAHFLNGSSVTRSAFSAQRAGQAQPYSDHVAVNSETFAVALQSNNKVYGAQSGAFTSQAAAQDYLSRTVAQDPTLAGTLHVLPQFEVAA